MLNLSVNSHVAITREEWENAKMSELSNVIYNRIESKFRRIMGDKARKFLEARSNQTLREVSAVQVVNIMDCFYVMS